MADALGAHEVVLRDFGGLPGILNIGMIESAIQRPYVGYYRSIYKKAAALVESVACNHGFADGNKRTCLLLLGLLLDRSGYKLAGDGNLEANRAAEDMIVGVAEHRITFEQLEAWMRERIERK